MARPLARKRAARTRREVTLGSMKRSRTRRVVRGLLLLSLFAYAWTWADYATASIPYPVPVEGVPLARIPPSFHAPREGGRERHQGIDIFARRGTAVRSAAWGVVVKIEEQRRGGRVVLVLGRGSILFFYAHLDSWAPGLHVGQLVEQGALLGRVGDTGNARGTPPHLHFEARVAATIFAPVDPLVVLGAPRSPRTRVAAALAEIGDKR
jgi:murein DD-endopeptidase MepM/ murein hydrolase activator NlpD